jgi:hypothetical protein
VKGEGNNVQFKGTCIAVEDSSYQSKKSGLVPQMTLTCFDADTESRLKDTLDVVLSKEDYYRIKEHPLNKTFTFHVREIRIGRDPRFRFDCRLESTLTENQQVASILTS